MSASPFYSLFESDLYEWDLRAVGPGQWLTDSVVTYGLRRMRYIGVEREKRGRGGDISEDYTQELLAELFPTGVSVRPSMDNPERDQPVLLMSPSAGMCLRTQCHDEEDHEMLEEGVRLKSRRWVLCIITDNCDQDSSSSHFSLIVVDLRKLNDTSNDRNEDEDCKIEKGNGKGKGRSGPKGAAAGATSRSCVYHLDSHAPFNSLAADHMRRALERHLNRPLGPVKSVACPQQDNGYDCGIYSLLFASIIFKAIEAGVLEEDDERNGEEEEGKKEVREQIDISSRLSRLVERAGPAAAEGYRNALRREITKLREKS